jgi:hypothetical protein
MKKKPTSKKQPKLNPLLVAAKLNGENASLLTSLAALYSQGVRQVEVTFRGSGDSGDIDDIDYLTARDRSMKRPSKTWDNAAQKAVDVPGEIEDPADFSDQLLDLFNEHVTTDWYNNEGGGGKISIDLNTLEIDISSYWYELEARDGDGASLKLDDEFRFSVQ